MQGWGKPEVIVLLSSLPMDGKGWRVREKHNDLSGRMIEG